MKYFEKVDWTDVRDSVELLFMSHFASENSSQKALQAFVDSLEIFTSNWVDLKFYNLEWVYGTKIKRYLPAQAFK